MGSITSLRGEARNPETSPERLHELAHLAGDRAQHDSDAAWCREYVAANPNVALATLQELATDMDDVMGRRTDASNSVLDDQGPWSSRTRFRP
ncbi:hypothetical protein BJQ90_01787 [Arthrobacter sp. SO3]|nr:hypothetical protein [Arthrobacter sp. SO3]